MIVSTRPLIDCCPVLPAAMEGRQLCQWDKDSCADAGFLKIDLLGLGMLSCVERGGGADRADARGADRPLADPVRRRRRPTRRSRRPTRWASSRSSRARRCSRCTARGPRTSTTSRSRSRSCGPGPILGGAVNPYIARRQPMREDPDFVVPYDHPSLEPVLRGHARDDHLPGPGDRGRDGVRRLLARGGRGAAAGDEPQALGGGDRGLPPSASSRARRATHGVDAEIAERVYEMIVGFSGFGFPKAHGAAFGLLAYQSTWLRVHYGPEFLCALLNEQPMGFYAPDTLAHEAQRQGDRADRARRQPVRRGVHGRRPRAGSGSGSTTCSARDATRSPRSSPRARRAGRSARSPTSPRAPGRGPRGPRPARLGGRVRRAGRRPRRARRRGAARRTALWRLGVAAPGTAVARAGTQLALPLELPGAPALEPLARLGRDGRRLRDDRADARPAPARAAAARAARRRGLDARPRDAGARHAGDDRRARRRPPAAGDREGDRLPAARGRVRDDQPDRPARPSTSATASPCGPSRCCSPRGRLEKLPIGRRRAQHLRARAAAARGAERARRRRSRCRASARRRAGGARRRARREAADGALADFRGVAPAVQSFAAGRRR